MTSMTSGLLVPIGFEVSPKSVGAKSSSDTQDGRDEEVVKEGAHGPEGDKDCRVDVPRLKLSFHFFVLLQEFDDNNRCSIDCKSEKNDKFVCFLLFYASGSM